MLKTRLGQTLSKNEIFKIVTFKFFGCRIGTTMRHEVETLFVIKGILITNRRTSPTDKLC